MINWSRVLSNKVSISAIQMFVEKDLSVENVQRFFRVGKDRKASGDVRRLIRNYGGQNARYISKKALKRRNLVD